VFFFWILIYIEKEEKMKIWCNRVSKVFCLPVGLGFFGGCVNQGNTSLHDYLIIYFSLIKGQFSYKKKGYCAMQGTI